MNVENLTSDYILLLNGYALEPLATIEIPDAEYNSDDIFAAQINATYAAGRIDVASPPSPFPRSNAFTGETSGGLSEEEVQDLIDTSVATHSSDTTSVHGIDDTEELSGSLDGWTEAGETWTRVTATTFTVPGNLTVKYSKSTRIKLTQTTDKYFVVTAVSHSAGTTTVTVFAGTDHTLADAAITSPFYSYEVNPQGYPPFFNWTPTFQSDNANFVLNNGVVTGKASVMGDRVFVHATLLFGNTTTPGTGAYYHTAPITPGQASDSSGTAYALNSGVAEIVGYVMNVSGRIKSHWGSSATWTQAVPFTFGTDDQFHQSYNYRF